MSLPSQSARGGGRSAAVSTRRRRQSPVRSALPFLIVAVLVVIVWFTMRPSGVRTDEPAAPPVAAEPDAPAPTEIAQGSRSQPRSQPEGSSTVPGSRLAGPGSSPPRSLPGAVEPPRDEVDRALASQSARPSQAQRPGDERRPGGGESGGLLTRALDESPARPQTGGRTPTQTQTQTQAQTPTRNQSQNAGQTQAQTPARGTSGAPDSRVRIQVDTARRLVAENDRVGARALLSRVLRDPGLTASEAGLLRDEISEINEQIVFGRVVEPGDPITEEYSVQSGDSLSRIASRRELATHWRLIQRVNGLSDPRRISVNQKLKLVRGPFHAVVHKGDYRMDVWHGPPSDPSRWVYIRSFDVGLGEDDGTPLGSFVISPNKLENPGWVNPRNARERYEPNDPKNPIGEFWLGMEGQGEYASVTGYGIHGTIDPDSIGRSASMGCIRLRDDDVALVYELLAERVSRVEVVP